MAVAKITSMKDSKRKKKKIRKNAYLFFLFLFLSGVVYLGPPTFFTSAKGINLNDTNGGKPPKDDEHLNDNNQKNKKGKDESDQINNQNQTDKSHNTGRGFLDLFNKNKNDGNDYTLNFIDAASLVNPTDIIKNGTFIFDAVNYLFKKLKEGPANAGNPDTHALRPGKDAVSANEIKRIILIKLLKCVAVLILIYVVIRLTFTFIKKLINLIIMFFFKIIKLCCCGGS
ncbi:conserved Plasmodium protein, unknown function [Plasmodium knowlesi strain H]|uniref:Uncharacterized protein n=3 Tax=Plasmodium knowlesi TaxID=5850 RepID=A0A5K1U740_PLAKH|nr:conserved Plasmodium protein, unknown function [Plasmodium knowlesi strain H]OTN66128.1 Uncharacterized protein PKNOH_S100044400 [Plasmodium knowlesi]CAA9987807.1 conserved Plasmodium protein, unknown function [Plasmodium knowlesi strain H]SBO22401.1 conserved Plasmodium protein, unknown function [Plasmodium knowlesi strain H]SBO29522.1 conserved Plasmodium protein, unknown function [Plasmodium knowlesi strain H]VVS77281.1 conserved Plasmodium protein, unknown function [Plasmodium knowlesi |eukprot:XP_002258804.1 hypothetical protein, conserved in Plasmodium species [Plasmodium knowlesi strain H]